MLICYREGIQARGGLRSDLYLRFKNSIIHQLYSTLGLLRGQMTLRSVRIKAPGSSLGS